MTHALFIHAQVPTSSRLEFSHDLKEYFEEEFALPTSPEFLNRLPVDKKRPKVRVEAIYIENGAWRLVFEFPERVEFCQELEGNDLYLKFNQTVDSDDLIKAQEQLGYIIKRFANGFNMIYLVAKRPVTYATLSFDNTFVLDVIPDYRYYLEETRRVKIAAARLLIDERNYDAAFCALSQLEEEYPNDKDARILLASLEGLLPQWQPQVEIIADLMDDYPADDDLVKLYKDAYCPHSPFVRFERQEQRTMGLGVYQIYGLQTEDFLFWNDSSVLYGGTKYQLYSGHLSSVINNQGLTEGFLGTRSQVNVYLRNEWECGAQVTANAYVQEGGIFGGGIFASKLLPQYQGEIFLRADWHRPYWAVFETLAHHGREDLVKLGMSSVYDRYLTFGLEGGMHRVGIAGTHNGFTSMLASAQVFLYLKLSNPMIGINYSLDAEYVKQEATKTSIDGNPYNPVPYTSFENHTLRGYIYYQWWDRWYFTAYGGETFNRLGINAPTAGSSLKYVKPCCPFGLEVELAYDRFPSTTNQGATAEYYTATVTARF